MIQLTRKELRELADPRSWERGVEYFEDGRVHAVVQDGATVVASVQGQEIYRVRLSRQGKHLLAKCSCPVGRTGAFCKHCVAVGLACADGPVAAPSPDRIADAEGSPADGLGEDSNFTDLDRIRDHLAKQDLSTLVEILVEQALSDENLLRRLTMAAARGGSARRQRGRPEGDETRHHRGHSAGRVRRLPLRSQLRPWHRGRRRRPGQASARRLRERGHHPE